MKTKLLFITAALLGAAAVIWMGADFIGANPLALLVTAVIGFVYALGLVELVHFRRATASLRDALGGIGEGDSFSLPGWLAGLHPSLQNAVAQRVEGERVGLPSPIFTPYLVGLLVMLGLLGTFVGMVDTLHGAVSALQGSSELEAIRNGLAAPIQGLGLAFGTSVAGVATSAMLGLNSTLSRRERMLVTRELDRQISGPLQQYSLHYNRQQTFQAMQAQAHALPEVATSLSAMAGELERMGQQLSSQLLDNQQQFNQAAEQQYRELAASVDQSLRDSLAASGRLAGESIAPAIESAMRELSDQASDTHQKIQASTEALQRERAANEADWLEEQGKRMQSLTTALRDDLGNISGSLREDLGSVSSALREELGSLREAEARRDAEVAGRLAEIQTVTAERLDSLNTSAVGTLGGIQATTAEQLAALQASTVEKLGSLHSDTANSLARIQQSTDEQLARLHDSTAETLAQTQSSTAQTLDALHSSTTGNLEALHDSATGRLEALQTATAESLTKLQTTAAESLGQLNSAVSDGMARLETSAAQQLGTLETTAAEQLANLGRELQQPMSQLIATASETPRAAAEVIGKLREQVADTTERDNRLLEERQKTLQDLATLSESLRESAAQQYAAIESLVTDSSASLQGVSEQFQQHLAAETGKLSEITANAAVSTADIASLGESFSLAVQLFSDSNTQLMENLSRIEESMEKSTERSDEQMSYYVAQAREIIDQSMLSQREIIEELRRLGQTGDLFATEAAS